MTSSMKRSSVSAIAISAIALATLLPATDAGAAEAEAAPHSIGAPGAQVCDDPITFGYYRQWRDVATTKEEDLAAGNVQRLSDVPAEIDVVSMFATKPDQDPKMWQALKDTYLPALHAQGTEVVFTLWIDDFAQAPVEDTPEAYAAYARQLYDTYIGEWGVDGLDIDVESTPTGIELDRAIGIIQELGKLIGPQSGSGDYLIYDTNLTGTHPVFLETSSLFDYVLLQAYGRNVSTLEGTWSTFAPRIASCQFLVGFSFYEERGADWGDTDDPFETSRAAQYAQWQPLGGEKGGVFAYAIDRDGKAVGDDTITATDFSWMKRLDALALEAVGGHLPAVSRGVEVVGAAPLGGSDPRGRVGDVTARGDHAYVTTTGGPSCDTSGVAVIDLRDPSAPTELGDAFMPTSAGSYIGGGAQVVAVDSAAFQGDVLIHPNQSCLAPAPQGADRGGISLWDVSDPAHPAPIVAHVGDTEHGALEAPHDVRAVSAWTDTDGRAFAALADAEGGADLDILEITDPFQPVAVTESLDLDAAFGIAQSTPAGLTELAVRGLSAAEFGDRRLLTASAEDGGQVILDVTDPAHVSLVADTDYAATDEERSARGEHIAPDGDAAHAALSPSRRFLIGTDEHADPLRSVATIDAGPYAGRSFEYLEGANTPSLEPGTSISGPTTFVGLACEPLAPGSGTALIERGVCPFQVKADTIKAAGYSAGIVFNNPDACTDLQGMSMDGTTIPFVFVGRDTGLMLLGQPDLDCATAPAAGTPSHPATIGAFFDGWGYTRLFSSSLSPHAGATGGLTQIDTYAVPESQDPAYASAYGTLSAGEVAVDPDDSETAYIAHTGAGLRIVHYGKAGIEETGAFIADGGSHIGGVEVWKDENGAKHLLASDRDFGLYVLRTP